MIKIPDSVNAIIEEAFAEPVTRLSKTSTQSAEGYVSNSFTPNGSLMGNIVPVNKSNAERYGFSIESDIAFTTINTIAVNDSVRYQDKDYRVTNVSSYTNYNMVEGKLWD